MRLRILALGLLASGFILAVASLGERSLGARILVRYGSIPKGVMLEGKGESIEEIESIAYDEKQNAFKINGVYAYANPVSREIFIEVLKALSEDDRIGVSYTLTREKIVYGKLSDRSDIAEDLLATDMFLGGVVYGRKDLIGEQELPEKYEPVRVGAQKVRTACAFGFDAYRFEKDEEAKTYKRSGLDFVVTVIPLSDKRAEDGGHLPDMEIYQNGEGFGKTYGMECKANIEHLRAHKEDYLKMPAVAKSVQYGEAAAFGRRLLAGKADAKKLLAEMQPRRGLPFFRRDSSDEKPDKK